MCGIAGFIDLPGHFTREKHREILLGMTQALIHRGPDDSGLWIDEHFPVALGHRRLSILDLSKEGSQPMHSRCGRYVMTFNGEIYNFEALRGALEKEGAASVWRGHSDTEIFLEAIAAWGLEKSIQSATGMFAFALWDRQDRRLILARDRMGEKPLYFGQAANGIFAFASELKALASIPDWAPRIDLEALSHFLRFSYIPAPHSIYRGVKKLGSGQIFSWSPGQDFRKSENRSYWSIQKAFEKSQDMPFSGTEGEAIQTLETLLKASVRGEMLADVPLGAFLSGGIDSSLVVALMQSQAAKPVKTFTIGFEEEEFNEAPFARAVANILGTDHTDFIVSPKDALATIPLLPAMYDEPFSDSSQIPTYLIAKLTRQYVTVSLSGDGGDELFAGYSKYFLEKKLWNTFSRIPRPFRHLAASLLEKIPLNLLNQFPLDQHPDYNGDKNVAGDKLKKLGEVLAFRSLEDLNQLVSAKWRNPGLLMVKGGCLPLGYFMGDQTDVFQSLALVDMQSYLPDDILVKVDRAGMAASLETRVPFMDHAVVEFALSIPTSMKVRNGKGKWLLRELLSKYIPTSLIDRKKMGFSIPLGNWLRGPLRDWGESLLNVTRLKNEGFFHPGIIRQRWHEHLSGRRNWQYHLWDVMMFQAWLDHHQH